MAEYLNTPLFGVTITIIVYFISQYLSKKNLKPPILNPIALSITAIVGFLFYNNIDYEVYNKGGSIINFFSWTSYCSFGSPLI